MMRRDEDLTFHGAINSGISVPLARYEELIDCETRTETLVSALRKGMELTLENVLLILGIEE